MEDKILELIMQMNAWHTETSSGLSRIEARVDSLSEQFRHFSEKSQGLPAKVSALEARQAMILKLLWGIGATAGGAVVMHILRVAGIG